MKREWHPDELVEHWTILPGEQKLVGNKYGPGRLGFAVLLKFFQYEGRFPRQPHDVPLGVVEYVAQQVDVEPEAWGQYDWNGRSIEYHRAQIRQQLGFREASVADGQALQIWLCAQIPPTTHRPEHLREAVHQQCRNLRIEPPTPERLDRIVNSAVHTFETGLCDRILGFFAQPLEKVYSRIIQPGRVGLRLGLNPGRPPSC